MITKEAYKQKMEAELELAQAKLAELKAQTKSYAADVSIKYAEQVDDLEKKAEFAKSKLKELGEASEDAWERFKGGVESAWNTLNVAVRDTAAKFKK